MSDIQDSPRPKAARLIPIMILLAVAVVGAILLKDTLNFDVLRDNRSWLLSYRDAHFLTMALSFVAIYVTIVAFSLPGATVASVTGGFLFGLGWGTALNVGAATIGASLLFLAVRWGFGAALAARIEASDGKIARIQNGLRDNEWSVMFLLRLVPAVPFFVANLLPAMVGVQFRTYVVTTALGIVPGALVFTWIGVGLGEVFDRGENPDLSLFWEPHIIGPILGLAVLAALPLIVRTLRGNRVEA